MEARTDSTSPLCDLLVYVVQGTYYRLIFFQEPL